MNEIEQAKNILVKNNQIKILNILEKIEDNQQLAKQLLNINFEQLSKLYLNRNNIEVKNEKVEPIEYCDKNKLSKEEKEELDKLGSKIIEQNQYAVVTMAGGQGTRLGWKGPKGTYKLDIGENGKYIFEILVDTLKRAEKKHGVAPYWYIMTSIENNNATISFFEEHNYFGYNKERVKFFTQGVLPVIDFEGNLLIDKNHNVKQASDGNGGVYKALKKTGMLEDMKSHNVKWVYICGVDNIMANMVDETLLGLAIKNKVQSASKSVKKAYPEEPVGAFCKKNGKPAVIEYIELSKDMVYAKNENGELKYGEANFVAHLFKLEIIEKIASYDLKYHCAQKKNSFIDENLKEIIPEIPNTYKFETFIFDAFEYLDNMAILSVNREEEFSPTKNATGIDSPETSKRIYENYFFKKGKN